jgi:hypothetical protein
MFNHGVLLCPRDTRSEEQRQLRRQRSLGAELILTVVFKHSRHGAAATTIYAYLALVTVEQQPLDG